MKFQLIIDPTAEETLVATVHAPNELTQKIEALIAEEANADRIPAYRDNETVLLPFSQIACISVTDGKTVVIDQEGSEYRLKGRLYEVETLLPGYFIRINKSAIANEKQIVRFQTAFSGAVDAVFRCGHREYVSRRCFSIIRRRYQL